MTLYMETTKISPGQTVGEIQKILGLYGALSILTEYENKEVSAVSFELQVGPKVIPFRLPCRWKSVFETIKRRKKRNIFRPGFEEALELQSKRVAWRQILRWVEAQLALVDTGMVNMGEVFMPYISLGGQTFYEKIAEDSFKMIGWEG